MSLSNVRKKWLVSAMPRPLYPRERDKIPIVHETTCALGPVWMGTKKKALMCNHRCSGKLISIKYSECICSLSHPARKAPAPYYIVVCVLSSPTVYFTLSHKRHDFRRGKINMKCVLISLQFLPETFKNSARYPKCTQVFVKSTRYSCQSLKYDFSRHIFEKMLKYQIS